MSASSIVVPVLPDTADKLDRVARSSGRPVEDVAAKALARFAESELEILAGLARGLEDVRRGATVPHDQAMDELEEAIRRAGSTGA